MNIGSSFSAVNAFNTRMNVTANNVANVGTDGFKSSSVTFEGGQGQTVKPSVVKDNSPGPMVPGQTAQSDVVEASNVDLVKEMTQLPQTQMGYTANMKMIQTNYQMQGTLLNMFA
jgi:flagellar hook protein FlgE